MKALTLETLRPGPAQVGLGLLVLNCLLPCSSFATDPLWENSATITTPPQIDASNFVNSGSLQIFSTLPFETAHTLNFTNSGTMISSPGWLFDDAAPDVGTRDLADNFMNLNGGLVQSLDAGGSIGVILVVGGGAIGLGTGASSYLWVNASNVVNKGTLSVGGGGWLRVVGTNVDMARGALEVTALQPTGGAVIGQTNYINDVGITDLYWGTTNGYTFNSRNVYNGTRASAPPHRVQFGIGGPNVFRSFSVNQPYTWGYSNATDFLPLTLTNSDGSTTNILLATNIIEQGVFIGVADPTIMSAAVDFFPSSTVTNPFQTVCVQLAVLATNVITGNVDATTLYFYDTMAAETNSGLAVNIGSGGLPPFVSQRPANYFLSRLDDGRFARGTPGNVTPGPTYFFDPATMGQTNVNVTGTYAGYAANVDNLASEPPPTTPGTVTNLPGRVQVIADSLDMRATRVRGEGEVIVQANHLLSSAGAAIDCENLSFTLGSTNGLLKVADLAKPNVIRMKGNLYAWSGLWSNTMTVILTNNFVVTNTMDTNGVITGTNAIPSPLTNQISLGFHALILDGSGLAARLPVTTWDFIAHSPSTVVNDTLTVVQSFFVDSESLTVNGTLALSGRTLQNNRGQSVTTAIPDWVYTNAPNLLFLTNNGTLSVPDEAHFGDDRAVPYTDFVNAGNLSGGSVAITSAYLENDGQLSSTVGPVDLSAALGLFQGGQTSSRADLNFNFGSLKFNNHQLAASGAIVFSVTGGLSDAGPTSSNVFRTQNGFDLVVKPATGDLLGTAIQDSAPNFVEVDHTWAGQDRGASAAGYQDNTALGTLSFKVQNTTAAQAPLFFFTGTNGQCGLYVDLLDLSALGTNFLSYLQIDPSLTIYYAAAKLSFTPPSNATGIPQEPEEYLNGQLGGHLVWVSGFAGPNSSVDVVINGVTVSVNRALRFSKIIDSNGNGIPNFYDPFPFNGGGPLVLKASFVQTNQLPSGSVAVSWVAAPQKSYEVEYTTDMVHGSWQTLTQYTHTSASSSTVTIWDTNAPAGAHRFYRVKTAP